MCGIYEERGPDARREWLRHGMVAIVSVAQLQVHQDGEGVGNILKLGLEKWLLDEAGDVSLEPAVPRTSLGHQLEEYPGRMSNTRLSFAPAFSPLPRTVLSVAEDDKVGGVIVMKEKMYTAGSDVFDEVDSSVTR
ncbi:hypothetical protein F4782DRAFT_530069 [Xylaria castorea]|nr:hypothetical protein F4782DRAFT_530069 [Xylaria castorea]